jgi:hypothetical protein
MSIKISPSKIRSERNKFYLNRTPRIPATRVNSGDGRSDVHRAATPVRAPFLIIRHQAEPLGLIVSIAGALDGPIHVTAPHWNVAIETNGRETRARPVTRLLAALHPAAPWRR